MGCLTPNEIRPLLPAFALALGLPLAIRAVLPAEEVGDFAMAGLGLGCAVLAAQAYGAGLSRSVSMRPDEPGDSIAPGWRARHPTPHPGRVHSPDQMDRSASAAARNPPADSSRATPLPVVAAMSLAAAAVFILLNPPAPGHAGLPIPFQALLALAPALGIVPWLTLRTGKPFAAVVLAMFIVALIKLAACVVVRIVYGPDAQVNGYMSADWQSARLMISLFWTGTVTLSIALGVAARRHRDLHVIRTAVS